MRSHAQDSSCAAPDLCILDLPEPNLGIPAIHSQSQIWEIYSYINISTYILIYSQICHIYIYMCVCLYRFVKIQFSACARNLQFNFQLVLKTQTFSIRSRPKTLSPKPQRVPKPYFRDLKPKPYTLDPKLGLGTLSSPSPGTWGSCLLGCWNRYGPWQTRCRASPGPSGLAGLRAFRVFRG